MESKHLFHSLLVFLLFSICGTLYAQDSEEIYLTNADLSSLGKTKTKNYAGIHDPSVVYDSKSNKYYIYGTHQGTASSSDMQSWTGLSSNFFGKMSGVNVVSCQPDEAFVTSQTTKVNALVNGSVQEVDFGPFDAQSWSCAIPNSDGNAWSVYGNMWAPDIIYNTKMKKWCMYLSLNGPNWNCVIILLTSPNITGPFVYQGPVVYSGFNTTTDDRVKWTATDLPLVLGNNNLPSRYNMGGNWGRYWPNCIDPCVFYDDNGQLWMTYGSWSGGIFMFKLDESNGLRDYTTTYPMTTNSDGHPKSDPYFGTHIAGGYYVSGEGSYIQKIGEYYYLFVTNGGLSAKEGYVMRVFRSKNPDGPYVDGQGKSAVYDYYSMNYSTNDAETRGNLLVVSHNNLGFQTVGQVAQGHNSALVDEQGRAFVVYHTRFNTGNEGFQDRVRQLFVNKEGWLCAAPFEFNGETLNDDSIKSYAKYSDKQIAGNYQIHLLRYKLNNQELECVEPLDVVLNENGTITGDVTGRWSTTANTGYISLTVSGTTYSGVVLDQMYDGTTYRSISITGISTLGTGIWGVKMQPQSAIAYTLSKMTSPIKNNQSVGRNLDLSVDTYYGVRSEWVSSNPDVISNTGRYNPTDEKVSVTLTHRLVCENYVYATSYNVTANADNHLEGDYTSGLIAYYDFDAKPTTNHFNTSQAATYSKQTNGTLPELIEDGAMSGKVGYLTGGTTAASDCGYIRFPNPLKTDGELEGATISMWVKRVDDNWFGTLWAFTKGLPTIKNQPRLFITSNNYVSYTNSTDTFCINYPTSAKTDISKNNWVFLTMTISPEDGVYVYANNLRRSRVFESNMGGISEFDYKKVLATLAECSYFTIGYGNGVASANASYDDLLIYNRALSQEDVKLLYSKATRDTDFGSIATSIDDVNVGEPLNIADGIYDMSGRRMNTTRLEDLHRGIYIVSHEGKTRKIIVR